MQIKFLTTSELEIFFRWWEAHSGSPLGDAFFTPNIIVVEENGVFYAGICLYRVDAKFCIFDFLTKNPDTPLRKTSEAIDFLIQNLSSVSQMLGYTFFLTFSEGSAASKRYLKNGLTHTGNLNAFMGA